MERVKAVSLVLDFTLYPRSNINSGNVQSIRAAMAAGIKMPPVIVEKNSRRVVDGVHRVKAVLAENPDGEIEIVEKEYANDKELFLDATRYNSSHGERLDQRDRAHCLLIAEKLQIPPEMIAGALSMTVDAISSLRINRTAVNSAGLSIAIKRTIGHMAGQILTQQQEEVNEKLSGQSAKFYAHQLVILIESDLLDKSDERLFDELGRLHTLLDGILAT